MFRPKKITSRLKSGLFLWLYRVGETIGRGTHIEEYFAMIAAPGFDPHSESPLARAAVHVDEKGRVTLERVHGSKHVSEDQAFAAIQSALIEKGLIK